ncbi:SDR family NAD(P)-dependent oxidoreductase [Parafilimonas terrae]|uniref:NAD(P)-dependent dehydrogenase, short-chain alcohol dehydrogenase family n=1 Tax=Parafilimonas terrae TaxID=1465490 RepID=A0A1I5XZD4_9BACT|nr:glucose 1-dehydrogenase [Parafilimonas terrae]SFQ37220.1 NAD(P)-dependent dehydrogenase, short-chain alcohol dehydrogenase family [Parafilimonas terrae]
MNLKNKVAVITGGNSGIGLGTAKELKALGATVIITGRRKEALEKAAQEIGAVYFMADQSKIEDIDTLSKVIQQQYGKVDILFINAGITGKPLLIENANEENFDAVMSINFRGAYFTLNRFIPLLNEGASVVFLSSNTASMHKPQSSVYQASKAALNSIAKTAAAELASKKIRVNTVSPGPTRTNVLNGSYGEEAADAIWNNLAGIIPLKKTGTPADVAKMVAYLCSENASYITGADFLIDGGMTL